MTPPQRDLREPGAYPVSADRATDFSIREIAEVMTWSEDRVERLIDRCVKRDELLRDRIRRMEAHSARGGRGAG